MSFRGVSLQKLQAVGRNGNRRLWDNQFHQLPPLRLKHSNSNNNTMGIRNVGNMLLSKRRCIMELRVVRRGVILEQVILRVWAQGLRRSEGDSFSHLV